LCRCSLSGVNVVTNDQLMLLRGCLMFKSAHRPQNRFCAKDWLTGGRYAFSRAGRYGSLRWYVVAISVGVALHRADRPFGDRGASPLAHQASSVCVARNRRSLAASLLATPISARAASSADPPVDDLERGPRRAIRQLKRLQRRRPQGRGT